MKVCRYDEAQYFDGGVRTSKRGGGGGGGGESIHTTNHSYAPLTLVCFKPFTINEKSRHVFYLPRSKSLSRAQAKKRVV